MSNIDDNTAEPGGGSAQSEHRTGPEIDLGRRRFAWLTVGTAATATLMSRSALAGGGKMHCGGSWNHSAMHSMMQGKDWKCKGLSHTYWRKSSNSKYWPTGFRRSDKFHNVCRAAPARPISAPPQNASTPSWNVSNAPSIRAAKSRQTTPYWKV